MTQSNDDLKRAAWEKWKSDGKANFLLKYGVLRMGLPYGVGMSVFALFSVPDPPEFPLPKLAVVPIALLGGAVFGLVMGLQAWSRLKG